MFVDTLIVIAKVKHVIFHSLASYCLSLAEYLLIIPSPVLE